MGEGIAGWVAEHGEPVLVEDVRPDNRFKLRIRRIHADRIPIPCSAFPLKAANRSWALSSW